MASSAIGPKSRSPSRRTRSPSIHCVFHTPGRNTSCAVLNASADSESRPALPPELTTGCHSGSFISCPLFQRVQELLQKIDLRRRQVAPPADECSTPE